MIPNLKQKPLAILLAVLTLGFCLRAADAPAEPPVPEVVAKPAELNLEKARSKAKAAIDRAQAALDRTHTKTQAGVEKAQSELEKAQAKQGQAADDKSQAKAQVALERAETALERAQDKAQAEIEKAEHELEKAQAKLEEESIVQEVLDKAFAHHGGHDEPTVLVGQSVHVKTNETVHELVVVLGDAVVDGTVQGDLVVVLGEARVNGKVEGNAINVGKGLILGPNAVVDGNAVGVLGGVERAPGAKVVGKVVVPVKFGEPSDFEVPRWMKLTFTECVLKARPLTFAVGWVWGAAAAFLLGYLLLAAVFSRPVETVVQALDSRGITAFLMGLVALPFTAFISVILAVTGVGVIVLPFLWAALFVAALFGKAAVLRHLGGALSRTFKMQFTPAVLLLVGAVVVSLFYLIPYVGLIAWMVLTLWGLGAALLALFAGFRKERVPAAAVPAPARAQAIFTSAVEPMVVPVTESPIGHSTPVDAGSSGFAAAPAASVPPEFTGATSARSTSSAPLAPPAMAVPEAIALPRVGFGRRFWAALLDWMLLIFVVEGPVLNIGDRWDKVKCLLYLAYFIGFYVWRGTTLGGLVLGLKVVRLDGRKLDFACALVRSLGSVLSGLAGMLGWFWCAWDSEKQTWHDKLAGTVVVRVEKSQPLV